MDDSFVYETRCRRCGALTEWYFGDAGGNISKQMFFDAMVDYIASPRLLECKPCRKETVQDVVSYGTETKEAVEPLKKESQS